MMTLSGLAYWIGGGQVVSTDNIDAGMFLDDPIFGIFSVRSLLAFAAFALVFCLMRFTRGGRDIVAISRRQVAAAAGARPRHLARDRVRDLRRSFRLAGSLIAISLTTASPELGANLMLQAASAAIIGGVALSGGVGGPVGVMIGVFILATLNNGLSAMGQMRPRSFLANGLVLLAVVILDGRLARALLERLREHESAGISQPASRPTETTWRPGQSLPLQQKHPLEETKSCRSLHVLLATAALALAGMGGPLATSASAAADGSKVILLTVTDECSYCALHKKAFLEEAAKHGLEVEVKINNFDPAEQATQVDQALGEGPDAIVVWPADANAIVPSLRKIKTAGVPLRRHHPLPDQKY